MLSKGFLFLFGIFVFMTPQLFSRYKMTGNGAVEVKENERAQKEVEEISKKTEPQKKIDKNKVDRNVAHFQKNVQTYKNEKEVISELSNTFSLPVDRIRYFRNINFGYAEIVPALVISREAQIEPGKVLSSRIEGKAWKDISKDLFVNFDNVSKEISDILTPIKKSLPSALIQARPKVSRTEK